MTNAAFIGPLPAAVSTIALTCLSNQAVPDTAATLLASPTSATAPSTSKATDVLTDAESLQQEVEIEREARRERTDDPEDATESTAAAATYATPSLIGTAVPEEMETKEDRKAIAAADAAPSLIATSVALLEAIETKEDPREIVNASAPLLVAVSEKPAPTRRPESTKETFAAATTVAAANTASAVSASDVAVLSPGVSVIAAIRQGSSTEPQLLSGITEGPAERRRRRRAPTAPQRFDPSVPARGWSSATEDKSAITGGSSPDGAFAAFAAASGGRPQTAGASDAEVQPTDGRMQTAQQRQDAAAADKPGRALKRIGEAAAGRQDAVLTKNVASETPQPKRQQPAKRRKSSRASPGTSTKASAGISPSLNVEALGQKLRCGHWRGPRVVVLVV